jgi:hypothetical protein
MISRRQFIKLGASALAGSAFAPVFIDPYEAAVTHLNIRLERLPAAFHNLKVAQLSDIHFNAFHTRNHLARVVELANGLKPDLVIVTGDFVSTSRPKDKNHWKAQEAWPCGEMLKGIQAPLGCFAVLGNHDHQTNPEVVAQALNATGQIKVLQNRSTAIERDGARLWLAGIDDVTSGKADPDACLRRIPREECKIVAVHEPDFADQMRRHLVDFQISGHSHGGQIRMPVLGPMYLPPMARKYPAGHYWFGDFQLYTNRGIGMTGVPIRFLCPPEITLFTLKSEKAT